MATAAPKGILAIAVEHWFMNATRRREPTPRPLLSRPRSQVRPREHHQDTAPRKKRHALVDEGPIWPKTRVTIAADHWISDAPSNM